MKQIISALLLAAAAPVQAQSIPGLDFFSLIRQCSATPEVCQQQVLRGIAQLRAAEISQARFETALSAIAGQLVVLARQKPEAQPDISRAIRALAAETTDPARAEGLDQVARAIETGRIDDLSDSDILASAS